MKDEAHRAAELNERVVVCRPEMLPGDGEHDVPGLGPVAPRERDNLWRQVRKLERRGGRRRRRIQARHDDLVLRVKV